MEILGLEMAAKRLKNEKFWMYLKGEDWNKCLESERVGHFRHKTEGSWWAGVEENHFGGSPFVSTL